MMNDPIENKGACATPDGKKCWMDCICWQVPVALILLTMLISTGMQTYGLVNQSNQLAESDQALGREDVQRQLREAQLVSQKLNALAGEIVALAPTDPAAKAIEEEFRIQVAPRR